MDWCRFLRASAWAIQREPSSFSPSRGLLQSNRDLDPSFARDRIWRSWMFLFYWASDSVNVGTMQQASSMLTLGLSYREVIPCIFIGNLIISFALTANATTGAQLHIPFSIISRASFGIYGAWFLVISRLILGLIYFGINTQILSSCTAVMIGAIWPSFQTIPNHIPEHIGITTQGMVAYIVAWTIQLPFLVIPPVKMKYLFVVKSIVMTISTFVLLGWSVNKAGGGGPIFSQHSSLTGSAKSWAWMYCINAAMSSKTTLAASISDFSRYARKPSDQYWQVILIPVWYTLWSVFGIICTSASYVIYGEFIWDPTKIIARWDSRAGAFFMALAFAMGTAGTNISTNSVAVSNDFTALVPKYLNIRRGAILCAFLGGWACVPWNLQNSGMVLLNFLSGYAIFLAPAIAVMICDYFFVKKRCYVIPELYRPNGRYRYWFGVNWRAFLAVAITLPINLPGLAHVMSPSTTHIGNLQYAYKASWLIAFSFAFLTYYIANLVSHKPSPFFRVLVIYPY
ncbi:NCS1 nucleoside transporter family [Dendrothele bispora CBS 962.96]|uniref:NCS1 nucleoside transporter family n=1 Tax=Dendrothele bispora (strain CBS 962.96) TaxID=1314807 RepID=A0A4S8L273_DENBC|nr:NCS1 nucleoside transporter family [Dendrothele bispora CBS 962.96]